VSVTGNVPTNNRTGWSSIEPDEYSLEFIDFSTRCNSPVLDIGAGRGCATLGALSLGATVIANDIDNLNLRYITENASHQERTRLTTLLGRFPEIELTASSVGAINIARVLHFLTGAEIESGLEKMHRWLTPHGKVFALATTPWCGNVIECLAIYESRRGTTRWPGEMYGIQGLIHHPTAVHLPDFLHCLDAEVLGNAFKRVGFVVEKIETFRRKDCPPEIFFDGRENIGLIAKKL
jgi:hypothetical protein